MSSQFAKELLKAFATAAAGALGTAVGTHLGNQVAERWFKPASPATKSSPEKATGT